MPMTLLIWNRPQASGPRPQTLPACRLPRPRPWTALPFDFAQGTPSAVEGWRSEARALRPSCDLRQARHLSLDAGEQVIDVVPLEQPVAEGVERRLLLLLRRCARDGNLCVP